jgi:predicted phosphoadenosine phosphosulfate sulfurtransferase
MTAPAKNHATGRMRSKSAVEADVYTLAKERVREAFRLFDTVAVSFSGGKDSTAVLNVALEVAAEDGHGKLIAFHFDEEAISYETEEYVRRVGQEPSIDLKWLCLPVQHRNACSRREPYWHPWAPEHEDKWVRPLPPEAITQDAYPDFPREPDQRPTLPDTVGLLFPPEQYGRVGMLLGIRAAESITRTRAILARTPDSRPYIRPWTGGFARGNLFKVMPVYDWSTEDVWTAPRLLGWDYNRSYDLMEMAGISHSQQRVAPPYGEEPMQGLWMYAQCFPDIWDRMQYRVPGASTAARYSRTELYAYKQKPQRPPYMTWPEFIRFWVEKHAPKYQAGVAKRVQGWLRNHYTKTTDPLADSAPHPLTGVSWEFLLMIAVRGDFKDRKQANPQPSDFEKNKRRYDAQIAEMRARGEL